MVELLVILSVLTLFNYVLFLATVFKGLKKVGEQKPFERTKELRVAIVVPFRNEVENLPNVVQSLLNQSYPENLTEIIFVNDNSDDGSLEFLENHSERDKFKIFNVENNNYSTAQKKQAITEAINKTEGEIIFVTDADCTHDKDWVVSILKYFDVSTGFVAAPVLFESEENVFGHLQKIEFAGLQIAAAGLIGAGKPTTCSAANIAFRKKAFEDVDGYADNSGLSSGDDELLMQKIFSQTSYKVKFATGKSSVVRTKANKDVDAFINQRRRWASKSLHYQSKALILELFLIFLFFLLVVVNFIAGLFGSVILFVTAAVMFLIKMRTEYSVLQIGLPLLYPDEKFSGFFLAEIVHIPYILIASVLGVFGNFEWKGRKVRR
jgi:cellulose synthase/poly-beta-1,6-N-acetylglucosamine synthase-like glycosyltransferase